MKVISFIQEYLKHPRSVGAIMPSSTSLTKQMIKPIDFKKTACIVEYGPGTGVFTEEIIKNKSKETIFLTIETNEFFYQALKEKYRQFENFYIIHGSAEHIDVYLQQHNLSHADYIVSGLPFTSLPKDVSTEILKKTATALGTKGQFITFQYSKIKQFFFQTFFSTIKTHRVFWNIPPAYVFVCSSKKKQRN